MKINRTIVAAIVGGAVAATAVYAQGNDTRRVRITYQNMTAGQAFSPSVFMAHSAAAPKLFAMGGKASFGLAQLAEGGNVAPIADMAGKMKGRAIGTATIGLPAAPGKTGVVVLDVDRAHPMVSGAWMLSMTNDGFTGLGGVDAYNLRKPMTMTVGAYDAGSEKNNERKPYLVAFMGTMPDPEGGVVKRHAGIRGGADAPAAWKFDPSKPVARVTITPI